HNHSNASDGLFSAEDLVALAYKNGCDALALTDHDTVANIAPAAAAAKALNLRFIPGVEISVSWADKGDVDSLLSTIHIVGLNIDATNTTLLDGLASVTGGRIIRGKEMAHQLAVAGVDDIFKDAFALAENKEMLGRTHFARALVARGIVKDIGSAFKRYLTPGNPGYVPYRWASLDNAMSWIMAAGGVAVIAHPGRYKLTKNELAALFQEFKMLGGQSIEVVTGSHSPAEYALFAARCKGFGFLASRGADFHGLVETPTEPGMLPRLCDVDRDLQPVWQLFT
ncbi:MAG: PHP domain-containing protein, partial [Pseudomonadota bacterium]